MMDAVTYPDEEVAGVVEREFVPLRVDYLSESGMLRRFNVFWTPTVVLADKGGIERFRVTGYLPPDVFPAYLLFGRAKHAWETHKYQRAAELFDEVAKMYRESSLAPESVYLKGVSRRKATGDDAWLDRAADELETLYPDSDWALRTAPWREQPAGEPLEGGGEAD